MTVLFHANFKKKKNPSSNSSIGKKKQKTKNTIKYLEFIEIEANLQWHIL